jgi:hypothetical protein
MQLSNLTIESALRRAIGAVFIIHLGFSREGLSNRGRHPGQQRIATLIMMLTSVFYPWI